MKTGAAFARIRKARKITQGELAKRVGITQTYLSQIESDKRVPSMDKAEALALALGFPVYYFFFAGLEPDDVAIEKRATYAALKPSVMGMIEGFFLAETTATNPGDDTTAKAAAKGLAKSLFPPF